MPDTPESVLSDGPEKNPLSRDVRLTFGRNIREVRIRLGMSQQDVSRATSIDQSRIAQIEFGRTNLTLETMMRVARAVDCGLLVLLTPASDRSKQNP